MLHSERVAGYLCFKILLSSYLAAPHPGRMKPNHNDGGGALLESNTREAHTIDHIHHNATMLRTLLDVAILWISFTKVLQ